MAMKINVGLNRKVGEAGYGSRGASVNIETEVDGALAGQPEQLQERIRQLFALVRSSLIQELNGPNGRGSVEGPAAGRGAARPADGTSTNGPGRMRAATAAQVKALYAIARQQGIDLKEWLVGHRGVHRPDELSIREASQVIDELKAGSNGRSA